MSVSMKPLILATIRARYIKFDLHLIVNYLKGIWLSEVLNCIILESFTYIVLAQRQKPFD